MTRRSRLNGSVGLLDASANFAGAGSTPVASPYVQAVVKPPAKTLLQTFQGSHGYSSAGGGAFVLTDTVGGHFAMGVSAMTVTTAGTGGANNITNLSQASLSFAGSHLALLVKVEDITHLANMTLLLGDTSLANKFTFQIIGGVSANQLMSSGEWTWLIIPWLPAITGSPNRAAITNVQFQTVDDGAGSVSVHYQAIASVAVSTNYPNGAVVLTFDDSIGSIYSTALPIMNTYGFQGNLFLSTLTVGQAASGYLTLAQVQELQRTWGWPVGVLCDTEANHNAWRNLTQAQQLAMVQSARAWIASQGLYGADFFAYPGGYWQGSGLGVARQIFAAARTVVPSFGEPIPVSDRYRLRAAAAASFTLAQLETRVANAKATQSALIIHFVGIPGDLTTADFTSLMAYISAQGVPVITIPQLLQAA